MYIHVTCGAGYSMFLFCVINKSILELLIESNRRERDGSLDTFVAFVCLRYWEPTRLLIHTYDN
jgi:hypothetical protein